MMTEQTDQEKLDRAKRLHKQLESYIANLERGIALMNRARQLEAAPDFAAILESEVAPVAGDDSALIGDSFRDTIRRLARELGTPEFDGPNIQNLAEMRIPDYVREYEMTAHLVSKNLDNMLRTGELERVSRGVRGKHGRPARYRFLEGEE